MRLMVWLCSFCWVLIQAQAFAVSDISAVNNLKFESYSTLEGLSSSTCTEIFQDAHGFIWFGTIDGLNKYDGYTFEVFRPSLSNTHSISNNRINALAEDMFGNLWIGTANGLNYRESNTGKFNRVNLGASSSEKMVIYDLFWDSTQNQLWVATNDGILRFTIQQELYSIKNPSISHYRHQSSNPYSLDHNQATQIRLDQNQNLWVVTDGAQLNRYNPVEDRFERISLNESHSVSANPIQKQLLIDSNNQFWFGNDLSNLIIGNPETGNLQVFRAVNTPTPILDMYEDSTGHIWISTDGSGVYLFTHGLKLIRHIKHSDSDPFSLPGNQVSKILEDRNGIFWFANYNNGISMLDLDKSLFGHNFHQPGQGNTLSTSVAQTLLQDHKGRIWIGTDGGGLNLFQEKKQSFQHFWSDPKDQYSLSTNKILYLSKSHSGNIWVCTWDGGLNQFNPETGKTIPLLSKDPILRQGSIFCATEDSARRLWLGTHKNGLVCYDTQNGKVINLSNPKGAVFSMLLDTHQRLWLGTESGIAYLCLDSLNLENIGLNAALDLSNINNKVNYIFEDRQHQIWVCSDMGLHQYSEELKHIQSYSIENGLPSNLILGMEEDETGNFWIISKNGLSRLNPTSKAINNYNINDGLQGIEFQSKSILKLTDGRIMAGGVNGFNLFDPALLRQESRLPSPTFTNLKINNSEVEVGDSIHRRGLLQKSINQTRKLELHYNENNLSLTFVTLYYRNSQHVVYQYQMLGFDETLIPAGNDRSANYTNLPPGEYTFELRSSLQNNPEVYSSNTLELKILPPPWLTPRAYLGYILLFVALAWWGMKYYARKVRESKERELDQQKIRFFMNVSHEFRTPLTLIIQPVEKILSAPSNENVVKTSATTIQKSAGKLLNLVDQLMDIRKLELGQNRLVVEKHELIQFCKSLASEFGELASMKNIELSFVSSEKKWETAFDADVLEKIISNLLSNAIKFTPDGGKVSFEANRKSTKAKRQLFKSGLIQEALEIKIHDNGIGIRKEQQSQVFKRFFHADPKQAGTGIGLHFTKALVEHHGGEITLESEFGKVSVFTVVIPVADKIENSLISEDKSRQKSGKALATAYEIATTDGQTFSPENTKEMPDKNRPTILLVEDNKELRTHLKHELLDFYQIKEAANGKEGLQLVQQFYPDIIISDVMMPLVDGFELCEKVKSDLDTCHIPVILLTARNLADDKIKGFDTGADEYVAKPFEMGVLKARIQNLLEAKKRLRKRFASLGAVVETTKVHVHSIDEAFLEKTTRAVIEHLGDTDFNLELLLSEIGMSRSQFYRKTTSLTGLNPSAFMRTIRLKHAAELLVNTSDSIKEIAYQTGFNSTAYFSKTFKEHFGITPGEYIEQQKQGN